MDTNKKPFVVVTCITASRVLFAPLLVLALFSHAVHPLFWWALYALIEASDILDGHLSRRWRVSSDLGKTLDPLADILSRNLVMGFFAFGGGLLPWLPMVIILARELFMTVFRLFRLKQKSAVAANMLGKIKTATYAICIALVLLSQHLFCYYGFAIEKRFPGPSMLGRYDYTHTANTFQSLANIVLWISALLAVLSFAVYLVRALRRR